MILFQCTFGKNQNGGTDYMSEALYAQIFGEGYNYFNDVVIQPPQTPKTWFLLNPEQQAQLVEDAFRFGYFNTPKQWNDPNVPNQSDKQTLINYFDSVLPQLRAGQGAT